MGVDAKSREPFRRGLREEIAANGPAFTQSRNAPNFAEAYL